MIPFMKPEGFDELGFLISFIRENTGSGMINATEMAKPFGKHISQWLTDEYNSGVIHAVAVYKLGYAHSLKVFQKEVCTAGNGIDGSGILDTTKLSELFPDLYKVVHGITTDLSQHGTWIHEELAMPFAHWLSPKFAIWNNDRIFELQSTGTILMVGYDDPAAAARAWADEYEAKRAAACN